MDHIGAGVAMALEREQFFVIGAQMRGAIENIGDEGGSPQRKGIECCHEFNQAKFCGEAR